jgi:hypothetical protein
MSDGFEQRTLVPLAELFVAWNDTKVGKWLDMLME